MTSLKVLIVQPTPRNVKSLRVGEEARQVRQRIHEGPCRDLIRIVISQAARARDFLPEIFKEQPAIVHFSGHGDDGQLIFEDDAGNPKPVPGTALAKALLAHNETVRCVLLNACETARDSQVIADAVGICVGTHEPILDTAAIAFAEGFYVALAYGKSVKAAFEAGRAQVSMLCNDHEAENLILFSRNGVRAEDTILVNPR